MKDCPKCHYTVADDAIECPACGIVFAKYDSSNREPPQPPEEPASGTPPPGATTYQAAGSFAGEPSRWSYGGVTRKTLESLSAIRPWARVVAIYGYIFIGLLVLAAIGLAVAGKSFQHARVLSLVYLLYGGVTLALLLPLGRSIRALDDLPGRDPGRGVERYATEVAVFWRRLGLLCAVALALMAIGALAVVGLALAG